MVGRGALFGGFPAPPTGVALAFSRLTITNARELARTEFEPLQGPSEQLLGRSSIRGRSILEHPIDVGERFVGTRKRRVHDPRARGQKIPVLAEASDFLLLLVDALKQTQKLIQALIRPLHRRRGLLSGTLRFRFFKEQVRRSSMLFDRRLEVWMGRRVTVESYDVGVPPL